MAVVLIDRAARILMEQPRCLDARIARGGARGGDPKEVLVVRGSVAVQPVFGVAVQADGIVRQLRLHIAQPTVLVGKLLRFRDVLVRRVVALPVEYNDVTRLPDSLIE